MLPATQVIVPAAVPELPVEVFQVTELIPTLSVANPRNEMAAAVVERMLDPG
jgi:hypothetical protein